MKAILIAFLLLPYVAFVPSSTLAREPKEAVTIPIGLGNPPFIRCDPTNNGYGRCGGLKQSPPPSKPSLCSTVGGYKKCSPSQPPPPPCEKYIRNC
ncbi:hypothetical protein glysoja_028511 [Glycine soja]|uniref:Uncharacterized protein n=1 Tax=Glycine soja TaxID=3848 RepID=A0A0B2P2W1_GLYSO|nr:hypothetical protein glysoja_028511 [Glycine soja]